MPITWVNGGAPAINAANLNALPQVDKANVFTAAQQFNGGLGIGTPSDPKSPVNFSVTLNGPALKASGSTADKVANQRNIVVTGDYTGDTGSNPGFLWGENIFLLVNTTAGDGNGLTNVTGSLIEAHIGTPAGTTFDQVTGLEVDNSFFGDGAGAHINIMQSLYIRAPSKSAGSTATVGNAYTLVVEGLNPDGSGVGASSALSVWVTTGVTRLGGRLDVQNTIAANSGVLELDGTLGGACSKLFLNDVAGNGGHAQIKLGASGSVFALTSSTGSNVFVIDDGGGLQLTLGTTTTAPTAGGAGALPATPAGYATVTINGTARKVAYY